MKFTIQKPCNYVQVRGEATRRLEAEITQSVELRTSKLQKSKKGRLCALILTQRKGLCSKFFLHMLDSYLK